MGREGADARGGAASDPRRRHPPERTLRWVADAVGTGSRVVSVRRLMTPRTPVRVVD
jgi:hypothetical protein